MRIAVGEVVQPHQLEDLADPGPALGPAAPVQPEGDVARDRQVREQRVVLEHQPDPAALRLLEPPPVRHHVARDADRPLVRPLEPGHEPQRRRLAAAGGPDQRHQLAGGHRQVQAAGADGVPVVLADPVQDQGGRRLIRARCAVRGHALHGHRPASARCSARRVCRTRTKTGTTAAATITSAGRAAFSQKFSRASS